MLGFDIDWPARLTVSGSRVGLLQPEPTRSTRQRLETMPGMDSPSLGLEVSGVAGHLRLLPSLFYTRQRCGVERLRIASRILRRKPNATHKSLEARVGAQWVKAGPQQDAWIKPLFITFFEPSRRLILVAEGGIDHGNLRGKRIARNRAPFKIVQQLRRICLSVRSDVGASQVGGEYRAVSGELDRFLELCDCFPIHVLCQVP
jgi:hypothetical protein